MRKYLFIACVCTGWTVKAQDTLRTVELDDVVITGTKSEVPIEKSGKTIFKLTRKDIEANSGKSVADLLNEVPGIQTNGNFGPKGTNISYFVRGASSKRTLILIDGVPFNDPSGIDQTYDLRFLDLNQVESIEILKGGLSTLYGTGAAAGVINITLKKSEGETFSGNAGIEYGSFNTVSPSVSLKGSSSSFRYLFNGSYRSTDGFSAANDPTDAANFDDDGFKSYNFLAKAGYEFSEQFDLGLTVSLDDFETDFDAGAFADGDHTSEYKQLKLGLSPKIKWQNGSLRGDLFYSKLDRLFNTPDFFDPAQRFINEYDANNIQADLVVDQNLTSSIKLIGGVNYQGLSYSQPTVDELDFNIIDPYVSFIYEQSDFNLQAGARLNNHSEYGSHLIYNVNPSYILDIAENTRLKFLASWSTSFITPSLYQLYGPFGNTALTPEESVSAEGGISLFLADLSLNAVYFHRKDENLIDFRSSFVNGNFSGEYFNSESLIETEGLEFDLSYQLIPQLNLAANYTYVKAKDDAILFRVPEHKYGLTATGELNEKISVGVKYLNTGDRIQPVFNNITFAVDPVNTASFDLVDFFGSYKMDAFTISGAINNVFDEEYEAIVGFNSIGRNYSLKVSFDF